MGLDIVAYSYLRFRGPAPDDLAELDDAVDDVSDDAGDAAAAIHVYETDFDRLDDRLPGLYDRTADVHVWWHAEHGTHAVPASEAAAITARIAALRAGSQRAECPGDLAVLADDRPVTTELSFRAGSYSGYNWWREQLCRFALEVEPAEVWEDPDRFAGKPFVELINFSDAEGTIGPVTSAKLARDFDAQAARRAAWAASHIADAGERDYFVDSYADWHGAFALAARDGFVIFC